MLTQDFNGKIIYLHIVINYSEVKVKLLLEII